MVAAAGGSGGGKRITQNEFTDKAWQAIIAAPETAKQVQTPCLLAGLGRHHRHGVSHCRQRHCRRTPFLCVVTLGMPMYTSCAILEGEGEPQSVLACCSDWYIILKKTTPLLQ